MSIEAHVEALQRRHRALETEIAEAHAHPSIDDLETFFLRKILKYSEYSCGFSQSERFNLIDRWAL